MNNNYNPQDYMPEDHMDKLYKSNNLLIRYIFSNRLRTITNLILKTKNKKILDAGCGEGHLLKKLYLNNKNNKYYGADITPIALKKALLRCPKAKFKKMDLLNMSYKDKFFDIVICTETIEHIIDYKKVFNEFKRILKNKGILIITFPNENLWTISRFFLGRRPIKVIEHVNSFNPEKIKKEINMKFIKKINLPFNIPFIFSLSGLMVFSNE